MEAQSKINTKRESTIGKMSREPREKSGPNSDAINGGTSDLRRNSVLVMQYSDVAPLGNLGEWLEINGFDFVEESKGELGAALDGGSFDAVVILGSEASVHDDHNWVSKDLSALQKCIAEQLPVFGICFGAQMIAVALGETVSRGPGSEFGWHDISSRCGDSWKGPWFEWHRDWISLKDESWIIAGTLNQVQAFKKDNTIGVQFHPEATSEIVEMWMENDDEGARRLGNFKEKLSIDNQKLMGGYKERSFGLYSSVFSTFERLNHNPSEKKK
tara:strand:+ start:25 stop:840 length:816 start_codon:yes stop_codon:yes gene_type:complete